MDSMLLALVIVFAFPCIYFLTIRLIRRSSCKAVLPPGPRPFPIIGNILIIGKKPHVALADLSKTYGPVMTLQLGSLTTIVLSSPQVVKEALQKNDKAMSSRPSKNITRVIDYNKMSIVWLSTSPHWRSLRKICMTRMFNQRLLGSGESLRESKVQELVRYVQENCNSGQAIDLGRAAFTTTLNLISNTFFSIDLGSYGASDSIKKFSELVLGVTHLAGNPNFVDYFPVLRPFDPQGACRKFKNYLQGLFSIFDDIIDKRKTERASSFHDSNDDVLGALLDLTEEDGSEFTPVHLKYLLFDLFIAGVDTSSSTVEWAMTELLCNPEKMAKAQAEVREVVGNSGQVKESDISKLPYLQASMKEILRLHPVAPLLVPRKAESDVKLCGYLVPKGAQVLVNFWNIGRDSSIWPNPESFEPERFLGRKIDMKGQDFELIPFGAGRRICPGLPLASRMVPLMLASLLYSFNWKLPDGLTPADVDKDDVFGLTLPKAKPLWALPVKVCLSSECSLSVKS